MDTVVERLVFLRKRAGLNSKAEAAAAYRIGYEVYKKIEVHNSNDPRSLTSDQAQQIADYHSVKPGWVMFGGEDMHARTGKSERSVRLVGYIGAGQEVMLADSNDNELVSLEVGSEEGSAFRVQGPSMMPLARDGDIIYCGPERKDAASLQSLLGLECAVFLRDGRIFFKVLTNGTRKGRYTLLSYNAEPIQDVMVESAGPFLGLKRGSALRTRGRSRATSAA